MEAEGAFFSTTDYKLQPQKLGEGSYGAVYVAKNVKDNQEYAAKIINVSNGFDGYDQMIFLRESLILYKLCHPAIVKFIGINFKSFTDPKLLQPTIITEYLKHGSLKGILDKERNSLSDKNWTETKKYIILLGICDAMRYLHEQGIIHRDLKPDNILVDSDYYPRICDFGLSKCFPDSLSKSMKMTMTGQFGTPLYLPPEILRGDEIYDQSVDIYAFAMIAYEIATGIMPFSELGQTISPFQLINKIIKGYRPQFTKLVTEKMQNLISKCWSDSPEERPTFSEIFDELSSDFNFFSENLDEVEIQNYIDRLNDSSLERSVRFSKSRRQPPKETDDDKYVKIENELNEVKAKLTEYQNEHDILHNSNNALQNGLISLLNDPKERNNKMAINELKVSSNQGNRYATFILGLLYETGEVVKRSKNKAFKCYEKSAMQGNPSGIYKIGHCYQHNKGVKKDLTKALEYFERGIETSNAASLYKLGSLYYYGQGVEKNFSKAKEYFEKAAELGYPSAFNFLGNLYLKAEGVTKDCAKAKEYFDKAAELFSPSSYTNLGIVYENGYGVEENKSKAIEYYEKGCELGDSRSFLNLGHIYDDSGENGNKEDYIKAKEYFEKASQLGNNDAMIMLGRCYEHGLGVEQDYSKAKEWYEISAKHGNDMGIHALNSINLKLQK